MIPLPLDEALAPRPLPGRTVTRTGLRTSRAPRAAPRMLYRPLIGGWFKVNKKTIAYILVTSVQKKKILKKKEKAFKHNHKAETLWHTSISWLPLPTNQRTKPLGNLQLGRGLQTNTITDDNDDDDDECELVNCPTFKKQKQ